MAPEMKPDRQMQFNIFFFLGDGKSPTSQRGILVRSTDRAVDLGDA